MSRNGAGVYTLAAGNPVVTGTTISSTWANNTLSDIATALTQSLAKDGQTTPTANIPMGGFKITGLGAPTTAGDALAFGSSLGAVTATTGTFSGNLLVTAVALVGYGTGAGGTVTQITSKATQVTLNKPTGKITTNNAALPAGTAVEFGCVNSFVSADDVVIVNSSLNANYRIEIRNVAAGSFAIRITNLQGVSLSEAVAINFAVIKGATA
jgi:hypothetical protein